MAINTDALVNGILAAQDPQARENRRIVKGVLSDTMSDRVTHSIEGYTALAEKLNDAVVAGTVTAAQRDKMLAAQERILDATSKYVQEFLAT